MTPPACFMQIYKHHPSQSERAYFINIVNGCSYIYIQLFLLMFVNALTLHKMRNKNRYYYYYLDLRQQSRYVNTNVACKQTVHRDKISNFVHPLCLIFF